MIDRNHTILAVIDVQERMMPAIDGHETVLANVLRLVRGSALLGLPMLVTEQYPKGLGATLAAVREAMGEWYRPLEKTSFSACGDLMFRSQLEIAGKQKVIVCGVETHVCVYQTARDLRNLGYDVEIAGDAVGSRSERNYSIALERMGRMGIGITSVEMALFDMMEDSTIPEFKAVQELVKN